MTLKDLGNAINALFKKEHRAKWITFEDDTITGWTIKPDWITFLTYPNSTESYWDAYDAPRYQVFKFNPELIGYNGYEEFGLDKDTEDFSKCIVELDIDNPTDLINRYYHLMQLDGKGGGYYTDCCDQKEIDSIKQMNPAWEDIDV